MKRKFNFNDLVKCSFRGKETYGLIASCKGEYVLPDTPHLKVENKYCVKVSGTSRSQIKWEHELKKIKSFSDWDDAVNYLQKMH